MSGGGSPPPDRSVELRQLELQAAEQERIRQAAEQKALEEKLAQLRNDAYTFGRGSVQNYFGQQGVDYDPYTGDIEAQLATILAGVPRDDPNPSIFFTQAGPQVYNALQDAERNRYMRSLDQIAPEGFANRRITDTADDPILAAILAEQRSEADKIVQNMLDRGVITQSGYGGAISELDRQQFGAQARLNEIGAGVLEGNRQQLRDVANTGRQQASTSPLGSGFQPFQVGADIDAKFAELLQGLGGNIRSQVPKSLFETGGLAAIAGAASGAQNTKFDPAALGGFIKSQDELDEEENKKQNASAGAIF